MNNDPTAAGEDCILASLERPSNYRLYYNPQVGAGLVPAHYNHRNPIITEITVQTGAHSEQRMGQDI